MMSDLLFSLSSSVVRLSVSSLLSFSSDLKHFWDGGLVGQSMRQTCTECSHFLRDLFCARVSDDDIVTICSLCDSLED